jgi:hypothetical protein
VTLDGQNGSTSSIVYEFRLDQGGPPAGSYSRGSNVVTGPDGWIYFAGKSISRFNPATRTVEDLHRLTPAHAAGQLQLILGIDGRTLFGANESGRVYSYDLTSMRFNEVAHPGKGQLIGIEQMKNGNLLVIMHSGLDTYFYSVDANGVETAPAIVENRAKALRPARDVNGDVYVLSSLFGDQTLQRISNACFCLEELRRWPYGSFIVYNMAVRNGVVYFNPDSNLHRFAVATGQLDRLSNDQSFNYRLLPSGLMLMVGDPKRVAAINVDTYVPFSPPLLIGEPMDNDGPVEAGHRRQQLKRVHE